MNRRRHLAPLALAVLLSVVLSAPAAGGQIIDTVVGPSSPSQGVATDMYLDLGTYSSSRHGQGKFDADGNFIFAETGRHRIRKLNTTTGELTTIAGTGDNGLSGDGGLATQATLYQPNDVAIEPVTGDIYISDSINECIRMVNKATGVIIRIGGDGVTRADTGDGGPVINATFNHPRGLGFDSARNLYICNSDAGTIRKVTYDAGLAPEQRIITRVAGGGADSGEGVAALNVAKLSYPFGLHVTPGGDLYIGGWGNGNPSEGHRVRKVDVATGNINTVAGQLNRGDDADGVTPPTAALMRETRGVVLDKNGNIYIADQINNRIRKVDVGTNTISTLVGTGVAGYSGDGGPARDAQINLPHGVAYWPDPDAGKVGILHIMDQNHVIRKVDLDDADKTITTVAGKYPRLPEINGPAFIAKGPDGQMYFSNLGGHTVMRFNPSTGAVAIVAGTGTAGSTGDGGLATAATLNGPTGVVLDAAGNLYIAEASGHRVRKVDATTGNISTFAGGNGQGSAGDGGAATAAQLNTPRGLALDSAGDLYITDQGNTRIRKVTMGTGIISSYWTGLTGPRDIFFDASDNLYCADYSAHVIRKKDWVGGAVTTVAGIAGSSGYTGDGGLATAAKLSGPYGVTISPDGANLYIGEYGNYRVRRVDLGTGVISTFAGDGDYKNLDDGGAPENAGFAYIMGLAFDADGYLYICDYYNSRIRRVTPGDSDLSVGVTADPLSVAIGASSTVTVTLQNAGLVRASATVTITLPAGLSLQGAETDHGAFDGGTLVWSPGNVCVWDEATLTLELEGVADGSQAVTAEVTTSDRTDPDSTPDNHAPAEDDQASVSVTVSGGDGATLYWHPQAASTDGNAAANWTTDQAGLIRMVAINATHSLSFDGTGTNADNDCMLTAGLACALVDCTGYTGNLSLGGQTLTVSGATFKLVAGMTFTHANGLVDLTATSGTVALSSGGKTLYDLRVGNAGAGATFQPQDAMTLDHDLTVAAGTFDVADKTVTVAGNLTSGTTSGLLGWWKMNDGSGTQAVDSSGGGHTCTLYNTPTWTTGKLDGGLGLDSASQEYGDCGSTLTSSLTDAITVSAWVKRGATANGPVFIVDSENNTVYDFGLYVVGATKTYAFYVVNAAGTAVVLNSGVLESGSWDHVVGTYDGSNVRIYVNGVEQGTPQAQTGNIRQSAGATVKIGTWKYQNYYYKGTVDEVRIYNRALSAAEIATLAAAGTVTIGAGTFDANGGYDMNSGSTTFTGAGRLELGGTVTSLGVLTAPSGTVSYDSGADQSVQAATYYNLEIDKSAGTATASGAVACGSAASVLAGTLDLAGHSLAVNDSLAVANGATLKLQGGETVSRGSLDLQNGSTVEYNGTGTYAGFPATIGNAYRNLAFSGSGTWQPAAAVTVAEGLTMTAGTYEVLDTRSLTVTGNTALSGTATLRLDGGGTLGIGGGSTLSSAAGSTFQVAGAADKIAQIQNDGSGYYDLHLSGNVNVRYARIDDLAANCVTLDGAGTTTFDNVEFNDGEAAVGPYIKVLDSAWNSHNFTGMAFEDVGGGRQTILIDTQTGDSVTVTSYASGAGWLSGDDSDVDEADGGGELGNVLWAPTAADGLSASAEPAEKGTLVAWTAPVERGTLGYRVLRREAPAAGANAKPGEWQRLAEVPAAAFGGEPTGNEYRWLDESTAGAGAAAGAGTGYEYRVEEVEAGGELPRSANAGEGQAEQAQPRFGVR